MVVITFFDTNCISILTRYTAHVMNFNINDLDDAFVKGHLCHSQGKTNDDVTAVKLSCGSKYMCFHQLRRRLQKAFKNLEAVQFDSILWSTSSLGPRDFEGFENLVELMIINTNLRLLSSDAFNNMANLKLLALNNNNIETVGKDLLRPLKNVKFVDFRHNKTISAHHGVAPPIEFSPGVRLRKLNKIIRHKCKCPMVPISCADTNLLLLQNGMNSDFVIRGKELELFVCS